MRELAPATDRGRTALSRLLVEAELVACFTPAARARRSPKASRRMMRACSSPTFTASEERLSFISASPFFTSSSWSEASRVRR